MNLIYLSPVPWNSFKQRPHRFVEWFHGVTGGSVLWIDPYPTRFLSLRDLLASRKKETSGCHDYPEWLTVKSVSSIPIEPLGFVSRLNHLLWQDVFSRVDKILASDDAMLAIGKPSKLAVILLKKYRFRMSLYDAMDDFPAFYHGLSRQSFSATERKIAHTVSKMVVSSTTLHKKWSLDRPVILAKNASAIAGDSACSKVGRNGSAPVLGYVGTVASWFDWPMVVDLAKSNPHAIVRIIGPQHTPTPTHLPANIELLPECYNGDAIREMRAFSVGLIPFKRNRLTASVDPIKYYEYRALGLPVISSYFGEMMQRPDDDGLFFMDDQTDAATLVAQALDVPRSSDCIDDFRENNSWASRFESIDLLIWPEHAHSRKNRNLQGPVAAPVKSSPATATYQISG
jgi:hypothetical protein